MKTVVESFLHLQGHQYMSLTTFRKNGQPVPTPVWFAQVGDKLYVVTQGESGKVKRIKYNAQVEVAPCDVRGSILGGLHEAMARILPPADFQHGNRALSQKYGLPYRLFKLMWTIQRKAPVFLEIMPM
ncbi:MAG: PPOX class F420-dependent oxidoreductase [Chloroflexota bacterium]|nr:PPOX class F420-dependent oxidoreductase [Chloroflexota bacterium]